MGNVALRDNAVGRFRVGDVVFVGAFLAQLDLDTLRWVYVYECLDWFRVVRISFGPCHV